LLATPEEREFCSSSASKDTMHTLQLNGNQSRYSALAAVVSQVVCSAPLSPRTGRPVAKASLSPLERGFQLQVHTLTDESSLTVDMPHVNKDVAASCLTYVTQRLAASGVTADEAGKR